MTKGHFQARWHSPAVRRALIALAPRELDHVTQLKPPRLGLPGPGPPLRIGRGNYVFARGGTSSCAAFVPWKPAGPRQRRCRSRRV